MLENKKQVMEMANDLGIKINGLNDMPEFGLCPTRVQIAPNKYQEVPGRFYTMSSMDGGENWEAIKEVSEQYSLVQHYEAVGALLEGIQSYMSSFGKPIINLKFSGAGNSRMFNDVKWKDAELTVNGDILVPVLRNINSVDLSLRFLSEFKVERLVCTNGLTVPDKRFPNQESVKKLHLKGTLNLQECLETTMSNMGSFTETIGLWEGWNKVQITPEQFEETLKVLKISEKQEEELVKATLRGFKGTLEDRFKDKKADLWIAYNSVTQWITDSVKNPSTESIKSRKAAEAFELLAV